MDEDLALFLFCADLTADEAPGSPLPIGRAALALAFHIPGWPASCFDMLATNAGFGSLFARSALDALDFACGARGRCEGLAWQGGCGGSSTRTSLRAGLAAAIPPEQAEAFAARMLRLSIEGLAGLGAPCLASCEILPAGGSSDASEACRGLMANPPRIGPQALRLLALASAGALELAAAPAAASGSGAPRL